MTIFSRTSRSCGTRSSPRGRALAHLTTWWPWCASWSLDRAEEVARAFTVYFHLANLAEEHHRVRVLRSRDAGEGRAGDSLASSVAEVRRLHSEERVASIVDGLLLHPVLTAHPTEARRRAVVTAISRAGEQLDRIDDPRGGAGEQADARRRLLEEIDILWRTAHLRANAVDPLDEVRTAMAVFDETLFRVVPTLLPRARSRAARRPVGHCDARGAGVLPPR